MNHLLCRKGFTMFTTFSSRLSWKTMAPSVVLHCCSLWDLQEPGFLSLSKIVLATNSIDQGSYESCKQNLSLWWVYMIMMLQSGRIHVRDIQNYKEMLFRWSSGACFFTCFWEDVKFETSSLGLAAISAEFWHMPTVGRGGWRRMCDIWWMLWIST